MMNRGDNRDLKGRFADQRHDEGELSTSLADPQSDQPLPTTDAPTNDAEANRLSADPDFYPGLEDDLGRVATSQSSSDLDGFVSHPNVFIRSEVASHPALSAEQAWKLADDREPLVRWQVSRVGAAGLADHLSSDPDPAIRSECLGAIDLSDDARQRLLADLGVLEVRKALTTSSFD